MSLIISNSQLADAFGVPIDRIASRGKGDDNLFNFFWFFGGDIVFQLLIVCC
jgi:hypothetical protein